MRRSPEQIMVDEYCEALERAGWQVTSPIVLIGDDEKKIGPPSVRRFAVPGGWLYQVLRTFVLEDGQPVTVDWHTPVFVPDADYIGDRP